MNRDAKRTADSPIGQRHVITVTVRELERQLDGWGKTRGKARQARVRVPKFEVVGTLNSDHACLARLARNSRVHRIVFSAAWSISLPVY